MRVHVIAMFALSVGATALEASAETAQEMMGNCKAVAEARVEGRNITLPDTHDAGVCWGAFATIQEMAVWRAQRSQSRLLGFCPPAASRRGQLIGVFMEYAKRNPARWHESFARVAIDALREAFPCR